MKSRKKHTGKSLTLLISLLLILGITVAGTLTYLFTTSGLLVNSFKKVSVSSDVQEEFNNYEKKNITVKNTGDIKAWIRVALVPTWEDGSGNAVNQTASMDDMNGFDSLTADWFKGNDGYYYCKNAIEANHTTPILFTSPIEVKNSSEGYKNGYHMDLQVLSEAIQDVPDNAVADAWNDVSVNEGKLEAVK